MKRPLFITFEGIDGTGKSSVIPLVKEKLEALGARVATVATLGRDNGYWDAVRAWRDGRYPTEAERELLIPKAFKIAMFLPCFEDVQDFLGTIEAEKADFVLCDRYVDSALAYQYSMPTIYEEFLKSRFLTAEKTVWRLGTINRYKKPDMTVLLDTDSIQARKNVAKRDGVAFRETHDTTQVLCNYRVMADHDSRFCVIDASKSLDEVAKDVVRAMFKRFDLSEKFE